MMYGTMYGTMLRLTVAHSCPVAQLPHCDACASVQLPPSMDAAIKLSEHFKLTTLAERMAVLR